eukprot:gene665-1285_t
MAVELKTKGNDAFASNDFNGATALYTQAIEEFGGTHILYTNRAAALFNLSKYNEAIEDCDKAVALDPTWAKAYFRKSNAQEKLKDFKGNYMTWKTATKYCEKNPWLQAQLRNAATLWQKHYKKVPIDSQEDFIERYKLLKDYRERLSTMAHFWNASSPEERYKHLLFLLELIGGDSKAPDFFTNISPDILPSMPMDNYIDLPRAHIEPWCSYYENQSSESKTAILKGMWDILTSTEQSTVIQDLKAFISQAIQLSKIADLPPTTSSAVTSDTKSSSNTDVSE